MTAASLYFPAFSRSSALITSGRSSCALLDTPEINKPPITSAATCSSDLRRGATIEPCEVIQNCAALIRREAAELLPGGRREFHRRFCVDFACWRKRIVAGGGL